MSSDKRTRKQDNRPDDDQLKGRKLRAEAQPAAATGGFQRIGGFGGSGLGVAQTAAPGGRHCRPDNARHDQYCPYPDCGHDTLLPSQPDAPAFVPAPHRWTSDWKDPSSAALIRWWYEQERMLIRPRVDRKSTRLNSSHSCPLRTPDYA